MSDWQNVDGFAAIRRRRRLEIIFPYHLDSASVRPDVAQIDFTRFAELVLKEHDFAHFAAGIDFFGNQQII